MDYNLIILTGISYIPICNDLIERKKKPIPTIMELNMSSVTEKYETVLSVSQYTVKPNGNYNTVILLTRFAVYLISCLLLNLAK